MAKTLFTSVRILDCTSAELYPGEVLVDGNLIAAIARDGQRLSRDNADVIAGGGATLMPGLIESHSHLSIEDAADLVQIPTGFLADLVLVNGDPLADPKLLLDRTKLLAVMKDGEFHRRPSGTTNLT